MSGLTLIDSLADQFERDWKQNRRPSIETLLEQIGETQQAALLREVIAIEIHYRRQQGETPSLDEYRRRFPAFEGVVESVVGTTSVDSETTLLPPPKHAQPTATPTGGTLARYTLSELHARGGLGSVWVAHDPDLNRDVALKQLRPETVDDPDSLRRFLQEAQVTGQLEHPNIVPVYEVSRDAGGRPYYTMRMVRGRTLHEAIREYHVSRGRHGDDQVELNRLLNAFVDVCNAVEYAHSRGVIHRDLKPQNVVMGGFGEVVVLDWGLAKRVGEIDGDADSDVVVSASADQTARGSILGTPAYMAPEQVVGNPDAIDARTDIYGLGSILFEILTGRAPHRADSVDQLFSMIKASTPRARQVTTSVPTPLDAVCAKAMALKPSERYAAARDLAEDVQRWLADQPVTVFSETWTARLARWSRRHRAWTQAGIAAMLLVSVVSVVFAVVANNLRERAKLAQAAETEARGLEKERADELEQQLALNSVRRANRDWQEMNLGEALVQLAECPPNHRCWEWRFLQHSCNSARLSADGAPGRFFGSAAFVGDAGPVVSLIDRDCGLWIFENEKPRLVPFSGEFAGRSPGRFSPHAVKLAAAGLVSTEIWDVSAMSRDCALPVPEPVLAFSPDSSRLLTVNSSGYLRVWSTQTAELVCQLDSPLPGPTRQALFLPDGRRLIAADNLSVRLFDAETGAELLSLIDESVNSLEWFGGQRSSNVSHVLACRTDGSLVAVGETDGTIRLFEPTSGLEISTWEVLEGCAALAFNSDGTELAALDWRGVISVFDLTRLREIPGETRADGTTPQINSTPGAYRLRRGQLLAGASMTAPFGLLEFSADGRRLLACSPQRFCVWELPGGYMSETYYLHPEGVSGLSFSPDSRLVATVGVDGIIKVTDLRTGDVRRTLGEASEPGALAVRAAFTPDGKSVVSNGANLSVLIRDAQTGDVERTLEGHTLPVGAIAVSPDSRLIASAQFGEVAVDDDYQPLPVQNVADCDAFLWDAATGTLTKRLHGHTHFVTEIAFSPTGQNIATCSVDATVRIWDVESGQEIRRIPSYAHAIAFHPDGRRIAVADDTDSIRIWNVSDAGSEAIASDASLESRLLTKSRGPIPDICFSPDGARLACYSGEVLMLWDVVTGQEVFRGLNAPDISEIAFSPDGTLLATSSYEGMVTIYSGAHSDVLVFEHPGVPVPGSTHESDRRGDD